MRCRFPSQRKCGIRRWLLSVRRRHPRPRQILHRDWDSSSRGSRTERRTAYPKARRGGRLPLGRRGLTRLSHPWRCPWRDLLQRDLHRRRPQHRSRPCHKGLRPWCREDPCQYRVVRPLRTGCRTRPPWGGLTAEGKRRAKQPRPARETSASYSRRLWTRTDGKPQEAREPRRRHQGVRQTLAS